MMNVLVILLAVSTTAADIKIQDIVGDKTLSEVNFQDGFKVDGQDGAANVVLDIRRNGQLPYLHAIEEDLLHQKWEDHEKPCLYQLLKVIRNVQNSTLWATWIWDSMQLPVGQLYGSKNHLGNYDQCLNLPWKDHPEWRTQYCLAELQLSDLDPEITHVDLHGSVQDYVRLKTKHGLTYNSLTWGICAPVGCKQESIAKFAAAIFKWTHLGQINSGYNVTVNSDHCHVAGETRGKGLQERIFLSIAIFLVMITLFCTWYVSSKEADSSSISDFAKAFDIKSNAQRLMKVEDKSVLSVLGIKVYTAYFVAAGHLWLTKHIFGIGNAGEIDKRWDTSTNCGVFNIDMTVDIFFMLSGLLFSKCIVEKKLKTFNPFLVILRRYIRFICSLVLILPMIPVVYRSGDSGPLLKKYLSVELEAWAKNWWKDVLMIGNYGDSENLAYVVLWSLACDFHFFVVGILIYCVYHKSRSAGLKVYAVCAVASVVVPVMYGYMNNSGAVTSFSFRYTANYRKYLLGDPAYVRTHLRAGPYFVGLAIGYLMALFPSHQYRNVISKKWSVFGFLVLVSLFASLYQWSAVYHVRQYGALEGALFSVMRRNVFAALFGFLIVICEYGTLPLVNDALTWSALVPLSKLSYGVYLTHLIFTLKFVSLTRVPLRSDAVDDLYSTFGMMAITYTMSLLMWLFWEAPMVNLFDMLFKRFADKGQQKENGEISERRNGKLTNGEYDTHDCTTDKKLH